MNTQSMTLDISKRGETAPVLVLRQGDKHGTNLDVLITDNGTEMELAGYTVRLCVKLPDGIHYYSVDGTVDGSTASFAIDETYAGAYLGTTDEAYVEVLYGSEIICSTHRFTVVVEPSAREGAEPGEQHIAEIDAVIAEVEALIDEIQEGAVFGVKGNAEETYRTGSVNLTPANLGAAEAAHAHAIADVTGLQDALDAKLDDLDVSITQTATGAEITVNGDTVSIANGTDGADGADGYSPSASVERIQSGATITIEDADGVTSATVYDGTNGRDGTDGRNGSDGITPTVEVTTITGGHNVAFDYGTGDPRNTDFDVMDGAGAVSGVKGDAEATYRTGDVNLTPADIGALALTGGTVAGTISTKNSEINRDGPNPSADTWGSGYFRTLDADGEIIGQMRSYELAGGTMSLRLGAFNESTGGGDLNNTIELRIAKDGTRSYYVADQTAFRNAIGTLAADYTDKAGSNLNNQQPGECWWGNNFTNGPRSSGYHQIFRIGMYQIAFAFTTTSAEPNMYLRSYVNSTWQPWARIDNNDIGKYELDDVTTNVSVPNSQYKTIGKVTLTAGTWIINFHAHFQTSANGYRFICISRTDNNSDGAWNRWGGIQVPAVSGGNTYIGTQLVVRPSSTLDYYGIGYQNSGGALNATGLIEAIRIK